MTRALAVVAALCSRSPRPRGGVAADEGRGRGTVALSLPSPGLQVGSVQGTKVVFAKGLEPELARALAAKLGVKTVRS